MKFLYNIFSVVPQKKYDKLLNAADNLRHYIHNVGHEPYEELAENEKPYILCQMAVEYDQILDEIKHGK